MSFFVIRWSLKLILNILYHFQHPWYWKVHKIFNSIVRLPVKLLSPSGIWNITSFFILMIFISLNRPLLHRSASFWIRIRALLSDDTDFSTTPALTISQKCISYFFVMTWNIIHSFSLWSVTAASRQHTFGWTITCPTKSMYTHFIIKYVFPN